MKMEMNGGEFKWHILCVCIYARVRERKGDRQHIINIYFRYEYDIIFNTQHKKPSEERTAVVQKKYV